LINLAEAESVEMSGKSELPARAGELLDDNVWNTWLYLEAAN
jgi:hypothetical protein